MFNKTKKIVFQSDKADFDILAPSPASRFVPQWYRKMDGAKSGVETIKKCVPVLDSLTAGYVIPLPADVTWIPSEKKFFTQAQFSVHSEHYPMQVDGIELPPEFDPQPHKWNNSWYVKTPPGYSTLFVHPMNHMNLPFYSFSGIVDTDKHPVIVNFPFVLRKDFEGTIPAGTPVIQAIPFKRDNWESKKIDDKSYKYADMHEADMPPYSWYKRKFWTRKTYS